MIVVYEISDLPVDAVGKSRGDHVVVLVRSSLPSSRLRELLEELLSPSELAAYDATEPA
jgi:hypothetical protein